MSATSLPAPGMKGGARQQIWLTVVVAAGLWLLLVNELRTEWSLNQQYSYGWVVPILALYLFWERWKDAPTPGDLPSLFPLAASAAVCALSIFPLRLLLEANPDWRLPDWGLAFAVVGLCEAALLYSGGWNWARHLGFPIAFFLIAVPWPVPLEERLMQTLMRGNAWMTVSTIVWFGIPAVQMGNVIQIPTGTVGIDEACSGVRSLQTTLMISLFLGELYRFPFRRRVLLLVAGVFFAMLCNLGRTLFLVWLSAEQSPHEMTRWHDTAGLVVLLVCLAGLWQLSQMLRGKAGEPLSATGPSMTAARRLPMRLLAGLACWLIVAEIGVEAWYRAHEFGVTESARWSVTWPTSKADFHETEIPETTKVILKYNEGRSGSWSGSSGDRWTMFFFRWFAGRSAAQLARGHKPDICLPAAGLRLDTYRGVEKMRVGDLEIPFQCYLFDYQGRPLHVFYCLWEDHQQQNATLLPEDRKAKTRLLAVLAGRRNLGQQVLEITFTGYRTDEDADAALRAALQDIIKPDTGAA